MINCPDCGSENRQSRRFCSACGATLPIETHVRHETAANGPTEALEPGLPAEDTQAPGEAVTKYERGIAIWSYTMVGQAGVNVAFSLFGVVPYEYLLDAVIFLGLAFALRTTRWRYQWVPGLAACLYWASNIYLQLFEPDAVFGFGTMTLVIACVYVFGMSCVWLRYTAKKQGAIELGVENNGVDDVTSSDPSYFPVSPRKFVALSVLTWGLYEIYWFYKNWHFIRERDQSQILPWARALFAPLWYAALIGDLRKHVNDSSISVPSTVGLAAVYFLMSVTLRLPDPFWLLAFLTFAPILPLVHSINALNRTSEHYGRNSIWKARHSVLALFSGPALALTIAGSTGLVPSTQVTSGWILWGPGRVVLERSAVLEPGERVLYYYSQGLVSFADDGNILTDRRVISYWRDEVSGEFSIESARFSEIADTEVKQGSWLEDTALTVTRDDGTAFLLVLSVESEGDKLFLGRLDGELRMARGIELLKGWSNQATGHDRTR